MKKLLLSLTAVLLGMSSSLAQDYPYAQDYFYISDSNWTLMTQFPQEGEGTLNVYFNGLTYKTESGGDRLYTTIGDMKGPFWGTNNSKNSFYTDESGNNVCIAFQNNASNGYPTGFSYTNSKTSVQNAINVASVDYDTKQITLSKAENIELTINGITPYVSPIALQAPEGVSVYEYESYSNGDLVVRLVENGQIQSNTPVILKSDENKLYTFDFLNGNSYDYFDVVKIQNPSQGKPVYFPDVNTGIIYGVQSPHLIPVDSYEFTNDQFTKVETKNTALINSFSCYLMLPEGTETYPETISIKFPEDEEKIAKPGYYLGGDLTEEFNDDPNPSYMFTKTEEGTYTLEVASIPKGTTFYVIYVDDKGNLSYYGSNNAGDTDLVPENDLTLTEGTLEADGELYSIGLGTEDGRAGYLNVTFTLTLDDTDNVTPYVLSYTGTLDENLEGIIVTVGNDKTMQSGEISDVDDADIKGLISMVTENENGVSIRVYAPEGKTTIYYYVEMSENSSEYVEEQDEDYSIKSAAPKMKVTVPDGASFKAATVNEEEGYAHVSLPMGEGVVYLATDEDGDDAIAYQFEVTKGIPTGVDAIFNADANAPIFNIFGQRVDESYRGIVIKNGKKYIQR